MEGSEGAMSKKKTAGQIDLQLYHLIQGIYFLAAAGALAAGAAAGALAAVASSCFN